MKSKIIMAALGALVAAGMLLPASRGIAQVCTVDWNDVHQRIDGFGASSAWRSTWTTTLADLLFSTNNGIVYLDNLATKSTNNGIGLSLLRSRIVYAGSTLASATPTTVETGIMQMAQARGASVWSAPWTPAVGFKSTNDMYDSLPITNSVNGGTYLGSGNNATNLAYASQLANYVSSMKNTYGVNLYAISVQNEPDASVNTYEACQWSGQQIHDFTTNLYNALAAKGVGATKIMLPESQNWPDYHNLAGPAMSDPVVAADVGILADHNYDGMNGPANLAKNSYGKPLWETEVSILSGNDGSITNGVYYGKRIHLFLTQAQANAYHYWWLIAGSAGNQGLLDNNASITKRLFVFGQYSRFVRPNYCRLGVTNNANTFISAFKDSNSGNFAIVAVNTNTSAAVNQTFNLTNWTTAKVTPWITSGTLSLASQSPLPVGGGSFTYTLPPLSVVTFVGQATSNTPPALAPVADQTINAGYSLAVTNTVTDTNQPAQSLTFSLLSAPANATLTPLGNGTNAVFSWRPLVSQANTTNVITVKVTDSGSPVLSATDSFTVTVDSLIQPVVSSLSVTNGQASLVATGMLGPDYSLWASTNLADWQALYTNYAPAIPVTLVDSNYDSHPIRFYRIQIGP